VQEMRTYTDSMDETLSARLTAALTGCTWQGQALAAKAEAIGEKDIAGWLRETV